MSLGKNGRPTFSLHAAMDCAGLDATGGATSRPERRPGRSDIPTDCEFLLDYEIDEEE